MFAEKSVLGQRDPTCVPILFVILTFCIFLTSNRIMVTIGEIAEYDSPQRLQHDGSSAFSKLVNEFLRRSL